MSCEESAIFYKNLAYVTHFGQNHAIYLYIFFLNTGGPWIAQILGSNTIVLLGDLTRDFLIDGRRSLIWGVRLGD